jgi:hypothetical protein
LLAYQKIYYDFFSDSQWEKHLAYAYNVDYWDGKSQLGLAPEMLQLRYANYPKDYFMGVLPNSQYGPVATLLPIDKTWSSRAIIAGGSGSQPNAALTNPPGGSTVATTNSSTTVGRMQRNSSDLKPEVQR